MANGIYDGARYRLLTATLNWTTANLIVTAWSGTPVFDPADKTLADVEVHGPVQRGTSLAITGQTVAPNGTAQTGGVVIPTVPIGDPISFLTMSDGVADLILFIDEAIELPFIPNGLDMVIQPDWLEQRGWWRP